MFLDPGKFVIIESCPAQLFVVQRKTEWMYQMQFRTGIRAQPDNITGIWRYLRLKQDDVKHGQGGFNYMIYTQAAYHPVRQQSIDSRWLRPYNWHMFSLDRIDR